MLLQHPMEWGAFLDHQAIGGDMFDVEGKGGIYVGLPVGKGFAWETVHEVDAEIADAGSTENRDSFDGLAGGMAAMEEAQALVVEGLDAHRDTIDGELL